MVSRDKPEHFSKRVLSPCALGLPRYGRGGLVTFSLIQKQPKNQASKEASLRSGPCPAVHVKPRAAKFLRRFARTCPSLQQKIAMPLPTRKAASFTCPHPKLFCWHFQHQHPATNRD